MTRRVTAPDVVVKVTEAVVETMKQKHPNINVSNSILECINSIPLPDDGPSDAPPDDYCLGAVLMTGAGGVGEDGMVRKNASFGAIF